MNHEILKGLTEAAAKLVEAGHPEDEVFDLMMTFSMSWAVNHVGPRQVSRVLYMLAVKAAEEAERLEGAPARSVN